MRALVSHEGGGFRGTGLSPLGLMAGLLLGSRPSRTGQILCVTNFQNNTISAVNSSGMVSAFASTGLELSHWPGLRRPGLSQNAAKSRPLSWRPDFLLRKRV